LKETRGASPKITCKVDRHNIPGFLRDLQKDP